MRVSRRNDRFSDAVCELNYPPVEVLEVFIVAYSAVFDKKLIVNYRLDLKIVVKIRYPFQFLV